MKKNSLRQIGNLLESTLIHHNMYEGYLLVLLKKNRQQIFGRNFGNHLEPMSLEKGRLVIRADSAEWRHEAELCSQQLLKQINQHSKIKIHQLFFV